MAPRLISRTVIAGLICALIFIGIWTGIWLQRAPSSPTLAIAGDLSGERWYNLTLDDRHLGYWHTINRRDSDGNWVFESEQRFAMNPYDPVATNVRRTFERDPPHRLIDAEHTRTRRNLTSGVRIERSDTRYRTVRIPQGVEGPAVLDWQYTLTDYLEFELWLDQQRPPAGGSRTVATLDFERMALVNRSFDVVEKNGQSYTIENAAPLSATRIQLNHRYAPVAIDIAGLFSLTLSTRDQALAPRSALQAASYFIPMNRRLNDHTRISRLVLAVEGEESPASLFRSIEREEDQWRLTLSANPISGGVVDASHLSETLNIPIRHPDIRALANDAVEGSETDLAKAQALTRFVHGFLSYKPGIQPQGVLALLNDRRGDCTEFADLLTTLARIVGLPTRTVFGLAYSDGDIPAFAYHAWNELFIDGDWVAMDPTWGQERVDATHIPLPQDETAALQLLTGSVELAFRVLEVEHFAEG